MFPLKIEAFMKDGEVNNVSGEQVNDISKSEDNNSPQEDHKGVTREELIEQLQHQVDHFDTLPQHLRFSFTTNADLYYFMLIILNILKKR
jgi:hypothetical protein